MDILESYGYWGMLISSFLAGSAFPFSSEAIMVALLAAGLDPMGLIVSASVGNVGGSMFNYGVGCLGKIEWIEHYLHIKKDKLDRAQRFLAGRGAWLGVFAFVPVLGSAITVALGLMKANFTITLISVTLGKVVRYVILAYTAMLII